MLDLNVLLDVMQSREPHLRASAKIIALAVDKKIRGYIPAHCLTTLHYIIQKHGDIQVADRAIDWVLANLLVRAENERIFLRARALAMPDFEDAVVAAIAESSGCSHIITRNVTDFVKSPIEAITPEEFLATF